MDDTLLVRLATMADVPTLARFNTAMALETEAPAVHQQLRAF